MQCLKNRNAIANIIFIGVSSIINKRLYSLILLLLVISPSAYAEKVGVIKTLVGEVIFVRGDSYVLVALGDAVLEKDRLLTKQNSSVGILFEDDTRLGAGANSDFSVVKYRFNIHSHQGLADFNVKAGTVAMVAGKLSALKSDAVKVTTPTETLQVTCSMLSVKVEPLQ